MRRQVKVHSVIFGAINFAIEEILPSFGEKYYNHPLSDIRSPSIDEEGQINIKQDTLNVFQIIHTKNKSMGNRSHNIDGHKKRENSLIIFTVVFPIDKFFLSSALCILTYTQALEHVQDIRSAITDCPLKHVSIPLST